MTERRMLTRHHTGPFVLRPGVLDAASEAVVRFLCCMTLRTLHIIRLLYPREQQQPSVSGERALQGHTILGGTLRPERVQQRCSINAARALLAGEDLLYQGVSLPNEHRSSESGCTRIDGGGRAGRYLYTSRKKTFVKRTAFVSGQEQQIFLPDFPVFGADAFPASRVSTCWEVLGGSGFDPDDPMAARE